MGASDRVNVFGFLFLILSSVATIFGFTTDQWILVQYGNVGLVRYCMRDFCQYPWESDVPEFEDNMPAWFVTCQTFMSLSLIFLLLSVLAAPPFLCNACQWGRTYAKFITINLAISISLIGMSLSILGAKVHYDRFNFPIIMTTLSWSYFITVAGGFGLLITITLFILSLYRSRDAALRASYV